MQHKESYFVGSDDISLYMQTWQADNPRAVIALVHGFGEHSGRYQNLVRYLTPRGYTICAYDHRGHGRSPGQRGHIKSWAEFRTDLKHFLETVRIKQPDLPLFLMGHSMGGLIALEFILHEPDQIHGVIASAPLLAQPKISPVLILISRILAKISPSFSISTNLDVSSISRDPQIIAAYQQDPLVHDKASAGFGTELTAAIARTLDYADRFRLPLLILQGAEDSLVPVHGGQQFYQNAATDDKELIVYPGGYHEPHNDLDHEKVLQDLATWLDKHI